MNFKKYHVSKNLTNIPDYSERLYDFYYTSDKLLLSNAPAGTYTLSAVIDTGGTNAYMAVGIGTTGYDADLAQSSNLPDGLKTMSFTISGANVGKNVYARFVRYYSPKSVLAKISNVMLNTGSTALPYDPPGNTWLDSHYIHNTSTDTVTTLPAVIYANGSNATVGLKGNTVQNGTPTPDSPIMPQGTGERSSNLVEGYISGCNIKASGGLIPNTEFNMFIAKVEQGKTYYADVPLLGGYFYDKPNIGSTSYDGQRLAFVQSPFTAPIDGYLAFRKVSSETTAMMNEGNELLPYEPYGQYKIPISSANTTTNVYLGEVQTTRKIRKLVLTGEENWGITNNNRVKLILSDVLNRSVSLVCSHYKGVYSATYSGIGDGEAATIYENSNYILAVYDSQHTSTAADFKTYLQQQYAAGTPVTVWYVLKNEETAVVNEPLMKIGDYADTLSNVSIPVIAGGDTISVDTTVQPSEVTVNYKGWHPVQSVHERENGAWT